ncbi:hypothetical protein C7271_01710 [filamentous cyanobacterium CCP5]|nr:hypothetical protein C7271_01710 [filamentous cyanobacterium CCP5]
MMLRVSLKTLLVHGFKAGWRRLSKFGAVMSRTRWRGLCLSRLFLLGFLATALSGQPLLRAQIVPPHAVQALSAAHQDLQAGMILYKAQRYVEAIDRWERSAEAFTLQGEIIGQAISLNNLSLSYQQIGQWEIATDLIEQCLDILSRQELAEPLAGLDETLAKALNTKGELLWNQGHSEEALAYWRQAAQRYAEANYYPGVAIAQINQAKALQSLGLSTQAVELLSSVGRTLLQETEVDLQAVGFKSLGQTLRKIGETEASQEVLRQGIAISPNPAITSEILLELGNTAQDLRIQALAIGKEQEGQALAMQSLQHYREAAQLAVSPQLQAQAQINQLWLLILTQRWSEAETLWPGVLKAVSDLTPSRASVYARLNLARSLTCLRTSSGQLASGCLESSQTVIPEAFAVVNAPSMAAISQLVATAVNHSRQLQDRLAESFAIGQLGNLYAQNNQYSEALELTYQAIAIAEDENAPESAFLWQRQLGKLLKRQGDLQGAIAAYSQTVNSLESIRQNLLLIDSEAQFSFRENAEPIYREFVDLLLLSQPKESDLRRAISSIDSLQRTELENFLRCDLSQLFRIDETTVDQAAAKIYPIILPSRLAVILEVPGKPLEYREVPVSQKDIEATLTALRSELTEPGRTPEVLVHASQVYQWLIAPIETILEENPQIQTLVFVPDGALRNIPLGVLYDGERYFIEKGYAIAIAPRLELFNPAISAEKLSILAGGIELPQTIEQIQFPQIEEVDAELSAIPSQLLVSAPLLNEEFTLSNLEKQLGTGQFSAIHWKTHGIFSSDPTETYLVAYQDTIRANNLNQLVQQARQIRSAPLELMILSACNTAQGDNRAVLGLAGLAVRAGARSTLSTLWRADDSANTRLMTNFYQALTQGSTKAQALQQAQVRLLAEGYTAPHYWATYVLVGNWL